MITIFTPTYNRAYILQQLYNSLLNQTNKEFEWIVVDDGSNDNTEQLINKWKNDHNVFKITYIKQTNQGKHIAINTGVKLAKGELFFIVDSDDYLSNNAIEYIYFFYKQIKHDIRFAGVSGMKAYTNGNRIGGKFPFKTIDCSMIDIRNKYNIKGDMAEIFKTNILKQFPFPQFKGENFLSESAVWNLIGEQYLLRYFNRNIYYAEYITDGLTIHIHKKFRENPQGTRYVFMQDIRNKKIRLISKIKSVIKYWRYTLFYKGTTTQNMNSISWMYLFLPIGIILYIYDTFKIKK